MYIVYGWGRESVSGRIKYNFWYDLEGTLECVHLPTL